MNIKCVISKSISLEYVGLLKFRPSKKNLKTSKVIYILQCNQNLIYARPQKNSKVKNSIYELYLSKPLTNDIQI